MLRKTAGIALVLMALFAGPAAAAEIETIPLEARGDDGIALRGHVYLPVGAQRPLATVLHLAPYFGGAGYSFKNTEEWADDVEIAFLLDAGYAVAAFSMRGTGRSEGCLRLGDATDQRDAYNIIQTIAAQPWSNGNVGMYGHSYPGWSQFLAAAARPPALKAIVPTSGIVDLWSLLTRRGAPISAVGSTAFAAFVIGETGHQPPEGLEQLACPDLAVDAREISENTISGDRTPFYQLRDLRPALTPIPVPVMTSIGMISGNNDGHILQLEGMWGRFGADRSRFLLGQWSHEPPTDHKAGWHEQVVAWFDQYLRGGPTTVPPGVVEYQDDADDWHTANRWPPASTPMTLKLSGGGRAVPDGQPVTSFARTFESADNDPGLKTAPDDDHLRSYNSTCGPTQALFASEPFAQDTLLAGNFDIDLTLRSTLPGGNLSVFLWRTPADGSCPDPESSWFGRALMDLRHWQTPGTSRDFPVGVPTRLTLTSEPFAARMRQGERIVVAVGGGSSELEPDPRHPILTLTGGTVRIPVVSEP
jgi:predicted acyl esterase